MPPVVFFLAVAVFAQGTSEFMLAGLLPDIAADLGITVPRAGLLTSAFAGGMIIGAPLMAAAGRRWSPRLALPMFLLMFIAMHAIGAVTDSFCLLLATRVLAALTNAGFLAVALSTVTAVVPADRTARALAVILGGTTLALIAGVPGGAAIGALLGWRAAIWGVAAISVPALLVVILSTPGGPVDGPAPTRSLRSELAVLRRRCLLVPLALGALTNGATFCAFTYLAPVVTGNAGLATTAVPVVLALFGIGAFTGVWIAGRLADLHAARILSIGGSALFVGWIGFAVLSTHRAAVIVLALGQGGLSFAVGCTLIAVSIRAAAGAPTMSGSFATASLNVGAAVGPLLGGVAYATTLGVTGPLAVSAALILAAGLLRVITRHERSTPVSDPE